MGTSSIKIKYLYHSGFLVETNNNLLIFDYYQGPVESLVRESPKNIFIFSSHSHPDHFNPVILEWQKNKPDIQYIFSYDINIPHKNKNINFLSPYEKLEIGNLKIKAYNSTDLGISFLVQDEEIRLFHAGDLNWWYWIDTPAEMMKAEKDFKEEVQKIKGETIDIAFFPVDPRLRENYSAGAEYFIQELAPQIFIPMHFADSPEITNKFEDKMKNCSSRILKFSQVGQELIL
ncbi:MBL fold metallo-hydrolase [Desulfosporosinus shakirovi]|uniref:MBL fold metallo-hydrolase n=1 Tax=Desulfosporosinus shakirovi TaxID=2885154 RepID=UPI001E521383|nr:MBL fold metallo-hydrolase [Desulfosporosinus sp. SRJS8]MCB8815201.1 MBL fold metallo-hydrolase [Desulfosporosinus sp. SRJS8]